MKKKKKRKRRKKKKKRKKKRKKKIVKKIKITLVKNVGLNRKAKNAMMILKYIQEQN